MRSHRPSPGPVWRTLGVGNLKALVVALALATTPAAACDVALVLAVDVSGSVDADEYKLQVAGLSSALGDPVVSEALVRTQAIVAMVQWSGEPYQELSVPWTPIDSHDDVTALRRKVITAPRGFSIYSTGIGEAMAFSAELFESAPRDCRRLIIDVSGDGASNEGREPEAIWDTLDIAGISVNGLAIEGSEDGITEYYRNRVIRGPGAFVEVANDFKDFPRAIRKKLLRELAERVAETR